jgi:hypothetical protein
MDPVHPGPGTPWFCGRPDQSAHSYPDLIVMAFQFGTNWAADLEIDDRPPAGRPEARRGTFLALRPAASLEITGQKPSVSAILMIQFAAS